MVDTWLAAGALWSSWPLTNSLYTSINVNVSDTLHPYHSFIVFVPDLGDNIPNTMLLLLHWKRKSRVLTIHKKWPTRPRPTLVPIGFEEFRSRAYSQNKNKYLNYNEKKMKLISHVFVQPLDHWQNLVRPASSLPMVSAHTTFVSKASGFSNCKVWNGFGKKTENLYDFKIGKRQK